MNFPKFLKTSFDGKPPVTASASYVCLRILENFLEHLFYRAPLGNCLFHVQAAEFQPPDTVKMYFTSAFPAYYTMTTSSHLKKLKT